MAEERSSARRSGARSGDSRAPKELAAGRGGGRAQHRPVPRHHHERADVRARDRLRHVHGDDSTPSRRTWRRRPAGDPQRLAQPVGPRSRATASLKASGGSVAPGCQGAGSGITVPSASGDYDYAASTRARPLKKRPRGEGRDAASRSARTRTSRTRSSSARSTRCEPTDAGAGAVPRRSTSESRGKARWPKKQKPEGQPARSIRRRADAEAGVHGDLQAHAPQGDRSARTRAETNFLNITAMMDMMTIILVFLLKSMSASTASVPQSDDLRIPNTSLTTEAAQEGLVVMVSKTHITVDDNVVLPGPLERERRHRRRYKASGPERPQHRPARQRPPSRWRSSVTRQIPHRDRQGPESSEAIIVADGDIVCSATEVLFTLGTTSSQSFHLMAMQAAEK